MAQPPLSPKLGTRGAPSRWSEYTLLLRLDLIAVSRSMGGIYTGQSAAMIGCDY